MVRGATQWSLRKRNGIVQPSFRLVMVPSQRLVLSHDDDIRQTSRFTPSGVKLSLCLAHSPLETAEYVPLSSKP